MKLFRTIRARIALLITTLLLIVLILAGSFLYVSLRIQLQQTIDDGLRLSAEQLMTTIESQNGQPVFGRGDADRTQLSREDDLVRLLLADGQLSILHGQSDEFPFLAPQGSGIQFITLGEEGVATGTDEVIITPAPSDRVQSGEHQTGNTQSDSGTYIDRVFAWFGSNLHDGLRILSTPVVIEGKQVAWLQVGRSTEPIYETLTSLISLLLIVSPIVLVITAGCGYWLAGRILRPIEQIRQQAAAISAQDLSKRLNLLLPDDEVGRLAATFDQMLGRLDESFRNQQRFVSDASHELRTPLAIIRGEVDVALENPRQPDEYIASLATIGTEAERMGRLVHDLLLLAQTDKTELPLVYEQNDLADLLSVLVETIDARTVAVAIKVDLDLPSTMPIWGDSDRLIQLFLNLLDNVLIYAPGSQVSIKGRLANGQAIVSIADTGPGIAAEHLPHLFERFYRVDQSRARGSGGFGLGLAISQAIVQRHGGGIECRSAIAEGTTFTVDLPINIAATEG